MTGVRAWIARHRGLAMWLVALALLSKALVPAGYMPGHDASRTIDVVLCSDPGGQSLAQQIVIPFEKGGEDVPAKHGGKGECAFTALAHGAVAAADPALLLAAIAFLFALGFAPLPVPPLRRLSRPCAALRRTPDTLNPLCRTAARLDRVVLPEIVHVRNNAPSRAAACGR
jgi:hypothetical protein